MARFLRLGSSASPSFSPSVIQRAKFLIQDCKDGSFLWGLWQTESGSNELYVLMKEMGTALDILPLSSLKVTADIREQIELLHRQEKRVELFIDLKELERRGELLLLMGSNNEKNKKNKGFIDLVKVKDILCSIGLRNTMDYEEETSKLEAEAHKKAGSGGLIVVSNINNLISLVSYCKSVIFIDDEFGKPSKEDLKVHSTTSNRDYDHSSSSQSLILNVPTNSAALFH